MKKIILLLPLLACACAGAVPTPRVVKIPVPVACEIEQVPQSETPKATADMNVFELAKIALVKLKIIEAENIRLRAANKSPCK